MTDTDQSEGTTESATDNGVPAVSGGAVPEGDYCCKVDRVSTAYGLSGIDAELERRYQEEDATLHDVAAYLNTRLTAATLDTGDVTVDAAPATVRAAIADDDTVPPTRRDTLREALVGRVDLDRLASDFVSHETIRRHLNEHLDISTSRGGFETTAELEAALEAYHDQYRDAIESALERAGTKGLLDGQEFRVFSTRVECSNCSQTYRLETLVENGGCDCQPET